VSIETLVAIFNHRWAAPILAALERQRGTRFVYLARALGIANESLRRTLDALIELGLVGRNPGYGHPLRPEYVLTDEGHRAALVCARLLDESADLPNRRKWAIPALAVLGEEGRFSEVRSRLPGVTSRSLALALKDLQSAALVTRRVTPDYPPSTVYAPTPAGRRLQAAL
jgi:DNA-binding HxlR family transcriptional regulator